MRQIRSHILVPLIVGLTLITGIHGYLENAFANLGSNWVTRSASGKVVVVAIDSKSIQAIGAWPWPRRLYANVIDILERAGASDIAFDVDFSSPSDKVDDGAFLTALKNAGGSVILPTFKQRATSGNGNTRIFVNRPLPHFEENSWTALVNVIPDLDGLIRQYPFGGTVSGVFVPSMATMLADGARIHSGSFWLDFGINSASIPKISFADVIQKKPSVLARLRGKKVIIGGTAVELGDRFTAPNGRIIPGPILQALATESILQGRDLQRVSPLAALAGVALVVSIMMLAWRPLAAGKRVLLLVGLAAAAEFTAILVQTTTSFVVDTSLIQVAIAAYILVIALDEINFRGILKKIAENRFDRVAMSLGDGLICANGNGRTTFCNPSAAMTFGYAPEEVVGRSIGELFYHCDVKGNRRPLTLDHDQPKSPSALIEVIGRRKTGECFPVEARISNWHAGNSAQYGIVFRDISSRKREAERIRLLAEFDTLTGLPNRHNLTQQVESELRRVQSCSGELALLLLDLDSFKEINDSLGHTYGDRVLVEAGKALRELSVGVGLAGRLGGDEFAIVVSGPGAAGCAQRLCEEACRRFKETPVIVNENELWVGASAGVAVYPDHGRSFEELLGNADLALYRAKAERRGRHMLFDPKFRSEMEARVDLQTELARAVEAGEFELFYQPQVDLATGKLAGAEALIRWRHPTKGLVPPAEFMPVVNSSSISGNVSLWVLQAACAQGAIWQRQGHDVRIAINLSPNQLRFGDLSIVVSSVLQEKGFSPSRLELEVTEDIVLADEEVTMENFRKLQEIGVRLAFDDFGTGYAGLSYLKKFPLDVLKIDRSFVAGLSNSLDDRAIVGSTITMTSSTWTFRHRGRHRGSGNR